MLSIILFVLGVIINVILTFWIVSVKLNAFRKERTYVEEIRAEMVEFMAALEENVAGYVQLMEKMRRDADGVLENINRKLRVVEKESQKLEQSRQTYSDLSRRKPLVSSIVDIQKQKQDATVQETPKNDYSSAPSFASSVQDLTHHLRDATQNLTHRPQEESPVSPRAKKGNAKQVAMLWREGKEAKEIAEKLNLSLGEVELALELMGSRRS